MWEEASRCRTERGRSTATQAWPRLSPSGEELVRVSRIRCKWLRLYIPLSGSLEADFPSRACSTRPFSAAGVALCCWQSEVLWWWHSRYLRSMLLLKRDLGGVYLCPSEQNWIQLIFIENLLCARTILYTWSHLIPPASLGRKCSYAICKLTNLWASCFRTVKLSVAKPPFRWASQGVWEHLLASFVSEISSRHCNNHSS